MTKFRNTKKFEGCRLSLFKKDELNIKNVGRLRFELRTSRLKAGCSTAELATHFVKLSTYEIIPF